MRSRLVQLDLAALDPDAPGNTGRRRVRLNLFPGIDVEVEQTRARRHGRRGRFSWFGRPAGNVPDDVVLSVIDGRASGSISLRQGFFQLRHVEGDVHEVTEVVAERTQLIDDAISPPAGSLTPTIAKAVAGPMAVAAAGDPVLDVLIVYTPEARRRLGSSQTIQDRIQLGVAEANASFVNSSAAIELNLVGMAEVAVTNPQSPTSGFLNHATFSEPAIQSLRAHYGADLVSVWVDGAAGNVIGIGWLNPGPSSNFANHAYSVVEVGWAVGPSYTFSHEAGHNLGGAHDRANAGGPGAFSFSYGHRYDPNPGGGFYTIMAYSSGCGGCSAANHWSNPNVNIGGVPSGVAQGQSNSADNAQTLTLIAPSASQFRAPQSPPANNPPTAVNQSLTVSSSQASPITLTANDPDGHTVYFEITTPPVHGTLTGSGASWSYTGNIGYAGPDSIQFHVRDDFGGFATGTISLNVQLPSSTPPTVSLAPPGGGPFTAPASITLVATASDADGSVDRVAFFANGQEVGSATSPNATFTFVWTNVLNGSYQLTAVARDNQGISTTSAPVSISVAQGGAGAGYTTRMGRLYYAFNENGGSTVADHIGSNNGTTAGASSWTQLGLKGGYVNTGVSSFTGNKLSPASGDAFTIIWVGQLDTGNNYQTLFNMGDTAANNVELRYYQPNGGLYLGLNGRGAGYFNAAPLQGKIVMVALRCAAGSCSWRVGSGSWINTGAPGTTVVASPHLVVGSDNRHYYPLLNTTSALFWVYGDALTDPEVNANFQFAGSTLNSRGAFLLTGYTPTSGNTTPVANDQSVSTAYQTARAITLAATDPDADPLAFSVLAGPSHGSLSGSAPNLTYTPAAGYSGPDSFTFQVNDGRGGIDQGLISINVGSAPPAAGYTTRMGRLYYAFNENGGSTVADHIGSKNGTTAGASSWSQLGLKGGYVNTGVSSFNGNKLSPASGDAFTIIWVGQLDTGNNYQTLFNMGDTASNNFELRYYQPNGGLYLGLNGRGAGYFNAAPLQGKIVMVALRCAAGSCSWRVGSGSWINTGAPGTTVVASPHLVVGSDNRHYYPLLNTTSALFWVYGDALSDPEVNANFQFAGSALNSRGGFLLTGYTPASGNTTPVANDQSLSTPYQTPRGVTLTATDPDPDPLAFSVLAGPSHGSLSGSAPNLTYTPAAGYSGPDSFIFQVNDGRGGIDQGLIAINVGSAPPAAGYTTRMGRLYYAFDENGGSTVADHIGSNNGTTAGAASWSQLGLKGGYVNTGASSFAGNKLSAASGDAFTIIWVGQLDTGNNYQTLFNMGDTATNNVELRYYQPNGGLYLGLNGRGAGYFNAAPLQGKIVMVTLRCAAGSCSWRVGSGSWINTGAPGTTVVASPHLVVGSDNRHYFPLLNATSALFWVYGDALTDPEVNANFQFAGSTLSSRGGFALNGYAP